MQHKFPFCRTALFRMEPAEIDVNVHPAKMEIRLIHGSELYDEISGAVRERLRDVELIPGVRFEEKEKSNLWQAGGKPSRSPLRRGARPC